MISISLITVENLLNTPFIDQYTAGIFAEGERWYYGIQMLFQSSQDHLL